MEDIGGNLFQAGSTLDRSGLSNDDITFIPPGQGNIEVIFKGDPLDEKVEPKLLEEYDAAVEMHQICRGCLSTSEVSDMQDTFIGGVASMIVYENISNIKIEQEDVPASMCTSCTLELGKIDKFIKKLKHSYTVLSRASKEVEKLNRQSNVDVERYNLKKINILRGVLQERYAQSTIENMKNLEVEHDNKNCRLSDDGLSDVCDDDFSARNDSDSDDEIPLSERFKISVNKGKGNNKNTKKTKQKSMENKNALPKKRFGKRKDNLENLPNNSSLITDKLNAESQIKDRLNVPNTCPLCSKNIRYLVKHLQSAHSLDWNDSRCSKCSYENVDKDKLVEHSRECEFKDDYPDYVGTEELKVEWNEEMDDRDEGDPDFELDDPEGEDMKDFDVEEKDELEGFNKDRSNKNRGRYKKFTCNKCENTTFKLYKDIEFHLKAVHSTESKCIICEQEFTNAFSLLYHMMVKHGKLKCCRLCLVSFRNSDELNAHYKSEEHNTKCTVCGEQFKNRKALYEHRRKKHLNPQLENQKYKCPECPKEFASQNNIRRHIMVAHNDLRFLCDTCGQSYTTKRNLKLHIQKFHEGVQVQNKNTKKNFFCEACGRELKIFHKYAIAMHRAKHKGHNFVCKKCYDSFPTEQEFKQHVKDLSHQLYECNKCQSQFVREENFKIHLKNHDAPGWNKNMFATWGKSAKLRNEKGEFVCSYCPKVFKDKQRLDNHVRVHTNERPYKCHICSKGFKTWIHRKTHLNIHLGIKKWVCKYCSKAFTNSCTLKGHEMIHTGERPHRCPECKKGFITMSAMKKHRLVHFKTGGSSYGKKDKLNTKDEDKTDSEHEENVDFMYKYGRMFTGSDVSYESFTETKEPPVDLVSIEKELSC